MLDPGFLARLEALALKSRRRVSGGRAGLHRSQRRGQSMEFVDHREYVPGDDIRHLDWHLAGRLDKLFIKLFEAREDRTVRILLDGSSSMSGAKWDAAQRASAAAAYASLCGLDRVQVFTCTDRARTDGKPLRGRAAVHRIFRFLQKSKASGPTDLARVLRSLPQARGGGITVLITDLWDPAGVDECLARLGHLGGEAHLLHVLDPRELDPGVLRGDLTLVDSETGEEVSVTLDRPTRERFKAAAREWLEEAEELARRRGVTYFRLDASGDVEEDLLAWLQAAEDSWQLKRAARGLGR